MAKAAPKKSTEELYAWDAENGAVACCSAVSMKLAEVLSQEMSMRRR